jgi:DNA-binding response OmpR family regulator
MANPRILVVDDDPKFLHFISEILIGAGYDVHCAAEPLKVVEMTEALVPNLVILDISMPGKDGFQVAKDLRASPKTKGVRCMFLTGHRAATHVKHAKEAGGVAYLEKPLKSSSLLWMVKTLLQKGRRK